MDIDNVWPNSLTYHPTDHQQQTYVTKHDLALLHKKIIATDLIVQKYQEANKALLALQIENDEFKQQIDQITNECCIFGKQVTECTQECDNLKEQIDLLNGEKRELHNQLRISQDENTNYYHEIMVLKQYESLKEINDESSKTINRQQKEIAKLQLKLQRKSPMIYKPNKNNQEPSETDIALTNSQKSVRELKLALGRLVNFIRISQIEIPTSLHIRPVLKAHEINDDFLEIEGEPVIKISSKPIVSQTDDDDDNDGDFIDVTPVVQTVPVNTTASSINVIEEIPISSSTSKSSSHQQEKTKKKKKQRQKKKSTKLDDLANELEMALSKPDEQNLSGILDFFSDDEDKTQKIDTQQISIPIYTPVILQPPVIHRYDSLVSITEDRLPHKPTKSLSNDVSFLSDDDNDDRLQQISSTITHIFTPVIEQQSVPSSSVNEETVSSLHVDSITPIEIETSYKPTKYMSFLSEDDDDDNNRTSPSVFTPIIEQETISFSSSNQEYIPPIEFNMSRSVSFVSQDNDIPQQSPLPSLTHFPTTDLSSIEDSSSTQQTIMEDSSLNENDKTISSSIPVNTLNSNRLEIVFRLLHVLTQTPIPFKPLRLVRRRNQQKKLSEESIAMQIEEKADYETQGSTTTEISELLKSVEENPVHIEDNITTSEPCEEQQKPIEENPVHIEDNITTSEPCEEQQKPIEENPVYIEGNTTISDPYEEQGNSIEENHVHIETISGPYEEQQKLIEENPVHIEDNITTSEPCEEQQKSIEENPVYIEGNTTISEPYEEQGNSIEENHVHIETISGPYEEQQKSIEENPVHIEDNITTSEPCEEQQKPIEENPVYIEGNTTISEPYEEQGNSIEENHVHIETISGPYEEQQKPIEENHVHIETISGPYEEQQKPIEENPVHIEDNITTSESCEEQRKPIEENPVYIEGNTTISEPYEEQGNSIEENHVHIETISGPYEEQQKPSEEPLTKIEVTSVVSQLSIVVPVQFEPCLPVKNEEKKLFSPPLVSEISKQSLVKSSHISKISRLLNVLINLPVKPLILPEPFSRPKRKRKTVVNEPSVTLSRQISARTPRSPTRMQTRSFNTIRACIARCNQPKTVAKKRTATESILPSPVPKRIRSTKIKADTNEYEIVDKFLNSFSKEINDELNNFLNRKLHEDILEFDDNLYRIINEFMIKKCDIILPLVKHLHPYEESIKILFTFINHQSEVFQHQFITKLNQTFQDEIKQKQISNNRMKILNRLFFLICSIFPISSSIIIYARLFDIGYYCSHDILLNSLSFISNLCSSLISIDTPTNSSNILLHRILFDIFEQNKLNISLEYLENLLIIYHKNHLDQEDLMRSFILISHHQTWLWFSNELCSKIFFPLLSQINEQHQRLLILRLLQYILYLYKDNEHFLQDIIFHDQIKQLLLTLKTMNNDECIVRDKIFFILQTSSGINK